MKECERETEFYNYRMNNHSCYLKINENMSLDVLKKDENIYFQEYLREMDENYLKRNQEFKLKTQEIFFTNIFKEHMCAYICEDITTIVGKKANSMRRFTFSSDHYYQLETQSEDTMFYYDSASSDEEPKKIALKEIGQLLEVLKHSSKEGNVIANKAYEDIYLLPDSQFVPCVCDEVIGLNPNYYLPFNPEVLKHMIDFDIVKKDTLEKVGKITYYPSIATDKENFDYTGNVNYHIYPQFQNKKYATRALALLKKALVKKFFLKDHNIYIAALPDNIASLKVARNCGGTLYYQGEVPKRDLLYYQDHVENVTVLKIEL